MASACLTLYETTFELSWFERARELADDLRRLFADRERGGFFQTGSDAEALVVRPKDLYDNATPSGNSAAADLLLRLSAFTGEVDLEADAVSALRAVGDAFERAPGAFGQALCVLDRLIGPRSQVAIVGEPAGPDTLSLVSEANLRRFRPNLVLAVGRPDDAAAERAVPPVAGALLDPRDRDGLRLRRLLVSAAGDRSDCAHRPARRAGPTMRTDLTTTRRTDARR